MRRVSGGGVKAAGGMGTGGAGALGAVGAVGAVGARGPLRLTPERAGAAIPVAMALAQGHFVSQALFAAVQLGVPDAIGDAALTIPEIAAALTEREGAVEEEYLLRVLRLLGAVGVLDESEGPGGEYAFALSDVGALLQTGVAGQPSLACGVTHLVEPPLWGSWGQLEPALRGGGVPFAMANGDMIFDYYAKHPESAKPFNEFMSFFSGPELGTVASAFDWEQYEGLTVVDIGGSLGPVAAAIKAAAPGAEVISFDLPEVTAAAVKAPLPGVEYRAGDMFDPDTLPQADCILMKHILHDWSDTDCERILASVRQSLRPGGRLVLAEAVLPRPGEQSPLATSQKMIDVLMLNIGGKERTVAQWEALVGTQGFRIAEIVATDLPMCQLVLCELQ